MEDYDDEEAHYERNDDYSDYRAVREVVQREPLWELYQNCIKPVAFGPETSSKLLEIICACLLCRFVCQLKFVPLQAKSATSVLTGVVLAYRQIGLHFLSVLILLVAAYPTMKFLIQRGIKRSGLAVSCMSLCGYLVLELVIVSAENFLKLRGCLMIATMKLISLSWDLDIGDISSMPNLLDYASYFMSPSSLVFGPWLSFTDHTNMFRGENIVRNITDLTKGLLAAAIGVLSMIYSSCVTGWLFLEHYPRWVVFFGVAQSFRFSHYFVSYFSQATVLVSGCSVGENDKFNHGSTVTRMSEVELPRSLVEVVSSWNIPMHRWLRKYVFKPTYGRWRSPACAVFVTYLASSLLHGLNFQLSAVLLSLGLFTYVEHEMREKFAVAFHACIRSRPCAQGCSHSRTKFDPLAICLNLLFSSLAVFNLIYLGMVFDVDDQTAHAQGYSMRHTLNIWSSVSYVGHTVNAALLIFAKSI